ncbi:MAG: cellobiose phosphorylase [Proteobacteria bacterium]|nr:MAG: cellobiose phosphorylase [Pseudomonadota bacterium]
MPKPPRIWKTPLESDLGLRTIADSAGIRIDVLPNGSIFAIIHQDELGSTLINQVLGSPLEGGIARILLRAGGEDPFIAELIGPRASARFGVTENRIVWEGETRGIRHCVNLQLQPNHPSWAWRIQLANARNRAIPCDTILVQDLGLGTRGFVGNNEAYASQYIDHHPARHPRYGTVLMCRQNLAQNGKYPWIAIGCFDGAAGFATDGQQIFGPRHRDASALDFEFEAVLPSTRLQHEVACVAIQSPVAVLAPAAECIFRFFSLYQPHHPTASSDADLEAIDAVGWVDPAGAKPSLITPLRSVVDTALPAPAAVLSDSEIAVRYSNRLHEERVEGRLLSFFTPDPPHNRHIVARDKERMVTRRHGALIRSGNAMLPDDSTLCMTAWMHGVFGAQLTVGNTSFHKLLSVSRDPYNIMHSHGLRLLVDRGGGWQLLTVPSVFEIGLSDCRWIYRLEDREIIVRAIASGVDPAICWRIAVNGRPCRFLIFGHLVLGDRELESEGIIELDSENRRFTFHPDRSSLWGQRYPGAVYHFVFSTPDAVDQIGGDELLYTDGLPRSGAYVAVRTLATRELCFSVIGSLTDSDAAADLAMRYQTQVDDTTMLATAADFWRKVTRGVRIVGEDGHASALETAFSWLVHDAMIHLTVPHGLEQYSGAAWGTRDVCQGPVEFLLALEHDEAVKQILRIIFAQQYQTRGDWPQWFMLEPYSQIQDRHAHGDVIVWPLKALNDYLEATNDVGFLDERVAWRDDTTLDRTRHEDAVTAHVDKLLATVAARFIPGTRLIRYGEGDWNDSLQPADPRMRDWMVSSWTIALLFQQITRYSEILRRAGRASEASNLSRLAGDMKADFNRFLIRDDTVAGYGLFDPGGAAPELLIHPCDTRTGLKYSLIPMTRSIIAGLFTAEQARHHLRVIWEHLRFPDGARLLDRPVDYHGGLERTFRRAESAAYFGREIGLMYVHAHIRYGEAMAVLGDADALWEALQVVNPVSVHQHLAHALPRQRNAYFSSSDAVFPDRYLASSEWERVQSGSIPVEGGWRIYSSGPGLYLNLLICHTFGIRRDWGQRITKPLLPAGRNGLRLVSDIRR